MVRSALLSGWVLWGMEFLPKDIIPDPEGMREWAFRAGLISDPDFQLITQETVEELSRLFAPQDRLAILAHVYSEPSGALGYVELPYVPIPTLIKKGLEVKLVYWLMRFDEVRFGFWIQGSSLEFASASWSKTVVQKFGELLPQLSTTYPTETTEQGEATIEVDGDVRAKFLRVGKGHDVELTVSPRRTPPHDGPGARGRSPAGGGNCGRKGVPG